MGADTLAVVVRGDRVLASVAVSMPDQTKSQLRSRLYRLSPIGMGTLYIESMTSYVLRLAESHLVTVRMLILQEIIPKISRGNPRKFDSGSFWHKFVASLNGTSDSAKTWMDAIAQLTLREDLAHLTMLPWNAVVSHRGLLRRTTAWCPACYDEWLAKEQPLYQPLLWMLEVVKTCIRHQVTLSTCCPNPECRKSIPLLAPKMRIGICPHCGWWLGNTSGDIHSNDSELCESDLKWHGWVVQNVGAMFVATSSTPKPVLDRSTFANCVSFLLEHFAEDNFTRLGQYLGVSRDTIKTWQDESALPQLPVLLRLSYNLEVPLATLLADRAGPADKLCMPALHPQPDTLARPKVSMREFDHVRIRAALEDALTDIKDEPPSMAQVAKTLGYDQSHIRRHFPELCRAISTRYLDYLQARREKRITHICDETRVITYGLHATGVYPSFDQVQAHLSRPSSLRQPEAVITWHAALKELYYE